MTIEKDNCESCQTALSIKNTILFETLPKIYFTCNIFYLIIKDLPKYY